MILLCLVDAEAQQLPPPPLGLKVTTEEAMLIVQVLERIGCPTVRELTVCQQAVDLLRSIREQVRAQEK